MRAIIAGVGHFAPENKLTNKDLEQMVDTNDEWITTRTGIKERRILGKGKGTSFMAVKAAEMVLSKRNISADELDLIIVATVTPDMPVPSTAALVQKELKTSNCWGFDLNGGCTGFVYALSVASQFVESGKHQKVMVIGADKMSAIIDYEDRNTCVLFGDAAGAVLIEPSNDNLANDNLGIRDFILHMDGSGYKSLYVNAGGSLEPASQETVSKRKHFVYQDGKAVFKRAVKDMADVSIQIMEKNNLTGKDIRFLIPHQANFRIIDAVAKKMNLDEDHVVVNIGKYGNTTAATIPLAMSEAYQDGLIKKGNWIVISAFGAGYTWGSCLIKWAMD
ncbi:MAG: beta-ketoacyl-ACP synthase III [Desulfobacterales bacterium]|nr:beta-ketoacyl-ACP synthase III [Desulfobacterales bacterium]MDX2509814.1 beta-ketoacyl-ACP synthase III [Desulfobacterales bacterium]